MHIPRLIQAKNQQTQQISKTTLFNSRRDWQNIKMATRKTGSKSAFIVPSPKVKRFTDTEAQMYINER